MIVIDRDWPGLLGRFICTVGLGWKASGAEPLTRHLAFLAFVYVCLTAGGRVTLQPKFIHTDLCAHASLFSFIAIFFFGKEGAFMCTFYWLAVSNSVNM